MMKTPIGLLALGLVVWGCSPSADEGRQVLERQIASESKGYIKLASFTKTDGQKFERMGVQGYRLMYVAQIEFDQNGVWTAMPANGYLSFEFSPGAKTSSDVILQINDSIFGNRQVRQGERIAIRGEMTATKSERGWTFRLGENRIQGN